MNLPDREEPDSDQGTQPPGQPGEVLADLGRLRRQARTTRHAYWFPLVLFGALIAASAPFFVEPTTSGQGTSLLVTRTNPLPTFGGILSPPRVSYYWLAALVTGLALTGWWYRRHGTRAGLRTPSRGFLLTGLAVIVVLLLVPLPPGTITARGTFPILIIAIVVWALARAERSAGLVVVGVFFTATALLADLYNVENILPASLAGFLLRYTSVPGVFLPALVLLVAGGIAFVAQRRSLRELTR